METAFFSTIVLDEEEEEEDKAQPSQNNLGNICEGFIFFLLIRMITDPDCFVLSKLQFDAQTTVFVEKFKDFFLKDGE